MFAIGGTTFGMAEESLAFYALIITVMIAAGYDALVGASILLLGCGIGVLGSTINPFATGIASGFAGVSHRGGHRRAPRHPRSSALRSGSAFVMRYAARVKADPTPLARLRQKADERGALPSASDDGDEAAALTGRQKVVLVLFILAFVVMIYGVIPWEDLGVADAHPVVVVPGDDGVVPVLRDPDRDRRPDVGDRASRRPSSTALETCSASR